MKQTETPNYEMPDLPQVFAALLHAHTEAAGLANDEQLFQIAHHSGAAMTAIMQAMGAACKARVGGIH